MYRSRRAEPSTILVLFLFILILRGEGRPRGALNYRPQSNSNDRRIPLIRARNTDDSAESAANRCSAVEDKCYKTSQCCPGLICMELNFLQGFCVKKDALQRCNTASDCPADCRCESSPGISAKGNFPKTGGGDFPEGVKGFCVPKTSRQPISNAIEELNRFQASVMGLGSSNDDSDVMMSDEPVIPGLGDICETSDDCRTTDSTDLCCQQIKRGRLPTKKMCDKMTHFSICI